jgi:hypothetical protein
VTRLRLGQRVEVPSKGSYVACSRQIGRVRAMESDRVQVETPLFLDWYPLALVKPAPLPPRASKSARTGGVL